MESTGGALPVLIHELATERGWSLREVARRCDLPAPTVQKIASKASITVPRQETLEALAYGFSVPLTVFLDAAAKDSGYRSVAVSTDSNVAVVVAAMGELSPARRAEIAALALAMLGSERRDKE